MRGKFVNGILIGGLVGMIAAMYYKPRMRSKPQRYIIGKTRKLGQKTGRIVADVAQDVRDFIRR